MKLRLAVEWLNKKRHLKRCLFYLAILVTPRPDAYVGKIVKGYKGEMRRPGEARRQSIVFASRKPPFVFPMEHTDPFIVC